VLLTFFGKFSSQKSITSFLLFIFTPDFSLWWGAGAAALGWYGMQGRNDGKGSTIPRATSH